MPFLVIVIILCIKSSVRTRRLEKRNNSPMKGNDCALSISGNDYN